MARNLLMDEEEIFGRPPGMGELGGLGSGGQMPPIAEDPDYQAKAEQVKQGLREKYGIGSSDDRVKLVEAQSAAKNPLLAGLAGFGAGLQGKSVSDGIESASKIQTADADKALSEFDKARDNKVKDFNFDRSLGKAEKEDQLLADNQSLDSERTKAAQNMLIDDFGMDPAVAGKMTAEQIESRVPTLKLKLDREMKKFNMAESRLDKQLDRDYKRSLIDEKKAQTMREFDTPYGEARTKDDAKQLKSAAEMKAGFDSQLGELIELREKHGGTNRITNSDAVGRAKQLSKELLLKYKDLSKLGVLSAADEKILNEIIPSDPLQYDMIGNPTLTKLKSFKDDTNKDFENRLKTRLQNPGASMGAEAGGPSGGKSSFPMQVRKNGKVATVTNADELSEAKSDGWN